MHIDSNLVMPLNHPESARFMDLLTRPNPARESAEKYAPSIADEINPVIKLFRIEGDEVIFPRYWANRLSDQYRCDVQDLTFKCEREWNLGKPINLRDYQKDPADQLFSALSLDYGIVLNALMGTGKTVVALEVARMLRQKTIVLVHTEFLMTQWVDRIKEFLGVKAGIIQGDKCELDAPIVIGMMQTLYARRDKLDHVFSNQFGTVIVDEVHRAAAPTFEAVIERFNARYRLGVSGTVRRIDDLQWIFYSHIGGPNVTMVRSAEYKMDPEVLMVQVPHIGVDQKKLMTYAGNFNQAKFLTLAVGNARRNKFILEHLEEQIKDGRKIIVFSGRRNHLELLHGATIRINESLGVSTGFIVGGMKQQDRDLSAKAQVIFCTYQLASEGLDIPELDCIFLATPMSNVQQAVGRSERALSGKRTPLVIDFVDRGYGPVRNQANKRARYYFSRGWNVTKLALAI